MERTKDFPLEYVKPFLRCLYLLQGSNVKFFDGNAPFLQKHWRTFIILPCVSLFYISLSIYMRKAFYGEIEFYELAYDVTVFMVSTQSIFKGVVVISKRKKVKSLIEELGTTWRIINLTETQIHKKNKLLKLLNLCDSVFYWMNLTAMWQFILAPLLETLYSKFVMEQDIDLLLPFHCSFPFDPTENWLIYIAIYTFEGFCLSRLIYIYLGAEFLMIVLCAHLTIEFDLLGEDLLHVRPASNKNVASDVISGRYNNPPFDRGVCTIEDIVRRHQRLIKLSEQLDEIFNRMIFLNLLFASIMICLFGFIVKESRGGSDLANNFVAVVVSILSIFYLCYYGELLTGASSRIADSAYHNLWYKYDVNYMKTCLFIIQRSQRACCLTSLKYAPITLGTFTTVLTTTWSYFSLVTSMYEEKN